MCLVERLLGGEELMRHIVEGKFEEQEKNPSRESEK